MNRKLGWRWRLPQYHPVTLWLSKDLSSALHFPDFSAVAQSCIKPLNFNFWVRIWVNFSHVTCSTISSSFSIFFTEQSESIFFVVGLKVHLQSRSKTERKLIYFYPFVVILTCTCSLSSNIHCAKKLCVFPYAVFVFKS